MNPLLNELTAEIRFTGQIPVDVTTFLSHHQCANTLSHSMKVAQEGKQLARQFGIAENAAEVAGWLHDISAVIPSSQRVQIARQLQIEILSEEEQVPLLLHQKLSVVLSREIFGITDESILSAIGCHTTLKKNASILDKVVFIADKMQWDQSHQAPYLEKVSKTLNQSLDLAVWCYLDYQWQQRQSLPVIHPWLKNAYDQLSDNLMGKENQP